MRAIVALFGLLALAADGRAGAQPADVREAAFAGSFYPADPGALRRSIEGFLADARPPRGERPIALVVPHAGYVYSGPIAADGYRQAAGYDYDVVVVLGTNHTVAPFAGVSIDRAASYRTPLGVVAADRDLAAALAADRSALARPAAHAREHSIEVQLPFVQILWPRAKVVTAVVGTPDLAVATAFGSALARALAGRRALIVASSDLSHYPPLAAARAADRTTLAAIATLDPAATAAAIARVEASGGPGLATAACGQGPILAALVAARALGARRGVVVSAATSGDAVAGEDARVVGYGAVLFTAAAGGPDTGALDPVPAGSARATLGAAERRELLRLARATLARFYESGTPPLPRPASPRLAAPQGAFVTLLARGELRGCIGHLTSDTPLALTVARMALAAALQDPRFPAVTAAELPGLAIEISALSPSTPIAGPEAIVVGRDGVVLGKEGRSAVFLPQVAPEQGWSRDELLDQLCAKAGLARDCWRRGATLSTFQADVFREPSPP